MLRIASAGATTIPTASTRRLAGLVALLAAALLAVPTAARATSATAATASATASNTPGSAPELDAGAPDLGRVVSLAEEFVLADLLALGITPVASTATVDAVGFQGIEQHDTSAIEVLPQTTLNLEHLAALRPDTIVTLQFWVDQIGAGVLDSMATVIVIPDGLSAAEEIAALGKLVGRPEHAAKLVAEIDAARTAAIAAVGTGCTLSLAAVYPGPSVAAFVDGPWAIPESFQAVGCSLIPGPNEAAPDRNGRAFLSDEQLGLLSQPLLVLMQNDHVEGESASLEQVMATPIWKTLPAVNGGRVVVVDRLGFPGAEGQVRFYRQLPGILGR